MVFQILWELKNRDRHIMGYEHCFKCTNCGAGTKTTSGVPSQCFNCGDPFAFTRVSHEEYNKLHTNEGDVDE